MRPLDDPVPPARGALLLRKFRDPGEDPKLYLFGQLKRIAREWLDGGYLRCTGGTYPAQLMYQEIADRGLRAHHGGDHRVDGRRAPDQGACSTRTTRPARPRIVRFTTSKTHAAGKPIIVAATSIGSSATAIGKPEFCRAAEANPRVRAYVKNQEPRLRGAVSARRHAEERYLPDFIVRVDDGRGDDDLLNLVVEIKGYRGEDAKDKANTMDAYWVPGVNNLGTFGRWAFAEFKESVYAIAANFDALIERAVAGNRIKEPGGWHSSLPAGAPESRRRGSGCPLSRA